jgi:hypothetical protein
MDPVAFSVASAVTEVSPGRFDADVHPGWTIGGKPNGGYLLATMGRAAVAVSAHEHVISASTHYLHSPDPGPVIIVVEVLRAGRSASQVRARMSQGEQPCVEALFTISRLDPETAPYWSAGAPRAGTADRETGLRLPNRNPAGLDVAIMDQIDLRLEPESLGFARGAPGGLGELRGWLELPDGEPFDPVSLLFAVDAFPPATFDIEMSGWVPTLELTVYVRALPQAGPVRVLQKAHLIDAQRVDEACWIWDSSGRIVAHGTQLAGIRVG